MNTRHHNLKTCLIIVITGVVTLLHYSTIHGHPGLHILHRELYFIPILLAGFWFGLNYSICVALTVTILYAPYIFFHEGSGSLIAVGAQVIVFMAVAVIVGLLVDRQRRQHRESLKVEKIAVLGRAAAVVGYEMRDLLAALRRLTHRDTVAVTRHPPEDDLDRELSRMEALVDILSSFVAKERVAMISQDLNRIVLERIKRHQAALEKKGVSLKTDLDENGCPSRIDSDKIGSILDHLIENALDVSQKGQAIHIRTVRTGTHCQVTVRDQGPGIKKEHQTKIFTPFFTTKENGQGLALAVCRKLISDMGGSIDVESREGKGAVFTLSIPRGGSVNALPEDILKATA